MAFYRASAFKVGILIVTISVVIAAMMLRVSEDPSSFGRSTRAWFLLDDATGIVKNSNVKLAGINIGIIDNIRLQDGRARIDLKFGPDVKLAQNARVMIRTTGILGDRYVEVATGDLNIGVLPNGSQILDVRNGGSMDQVMNQIGKLTESLTNVAESLKAATEGNGDRSRPLARIVDNIDRITKNIAEITDENKDKFTDIMDDMRDLTANLKRATDEKNLRKIDRALANIEEITDKVNSGKGTIGKLVNDEKTIEEINTAVAGVNKFLDSAGKLQTSVDFKSEYLMQQSLYKTYLGLKIKPGLDRYYEIAVIDDPKGYVERIDTRTTTGVGTPGESTSTISEQKTFKNKVKFNALFAKNFYDLTIKGGLIESTGGLGIDYFLLRKKLRLSFEAFDFQPDSTHLRTSARFNFYRGVYVSGGLDDFASRQGTFSSYLGAGLDFTNDDLKLLVSKVPF